MAIVSTVMTWCGTKLFLDHKNRVTAHNPQTIIIAENRRDFERLAFFTLAQVKEMAQRIK